MLRQSTPSPAEVQSQLKNTSSLVLDLLLPSFKVVEICRDLGYAYRERAYSPMVTIWMFITQVLSADHSCQQAVTRLNAWRVVRGLSKVSSRTTSYCKARGRLPEKLFEQLLQWTATRCNEAARREWLFHGREVDMVDGSIVTMADSDENQEVYPLMKNQRPGCGFPIARIVQVFSLATGAVNMMAIGPYAGKETGETSLLRTLLNQFTPEKILLADRFYASFWLLTLSELSKVDLVARVHQRRKVDFRRGLRQGYCDQIVSYTKPERPYWMSPSEYAKYPAFILVRHLRYKVTQKGFRSRQITLVTTLLDGAVYSAEELAALYHRRWLVELHIRSLKTYMQMEHLRCKSPQMVRKEIYAHMIGYNLVRAAMLACALRFNMCPSQLSFTGAMQAVEEFAATLRLRSGGREEQWQNLLATISELTVGGRPGRSEPRELKRRPKNYKLMRTPRSSTATSCAATA
jgi:putative transposase